MGFGIPSFGDVFDTLASGVGNAVEETSDFFTGANSDAERASAEAAEAGNSTRDRLDGQMADAIAGLAPGTGMLPNVVVPENFAAMTHEQIYAHAISMDPGTITGSAGIWRGAAAVFEPLVKDLWSAINPILDTEWRGAASTAARSAVQSYSDHTLHLPSAMELIASKLDRSSSGLEQTMAQVPEPDSMGLKDGFRIATATVVWPLAGIGEWSRSHAQAKEEHLRAIAVMSSVYTPVVVSSDTGVPTLPPPVDPTNPATAHVGGPSGGGSGGGYSEPGAFGTNSGTAAFPLHDGNAPGTQSNSAATEPAQTSPAAQATNPANTAPAAGSGASSQSTGAAPLTPGGASTQPASWVSPAGTTPGSSRYRPSASGSGSSGPGGGSSRLGGPSGALPLQAGGSAAPSGSPVGTSTSATRSMPYGAGGMMPGARANGDQDGEHKTPGYLVTVDNGDKLVGRLPLVAPSVID